MTAVLTTQPTRARRLTGITPSTGLAALLLGFVLVACLFPQLLTTGDPMAIDLTRTLEPPSWSNIFGTDSSGRDLYSRIVFGARESILVGLGAAGVSLTIAVVLGGTAALSGKVLDRVISGLIEVNLAFPTVLLALLVMAVFGPSKTTLIFAVGLGTAPGYARMVRGQVLTVKKEPYVEAAFALGHRWPTVIGQHILPNALRPLIAIFALSVGQSIVWASGLAFLGLGVAPPSPEWGALLDAGRIYITSAWWLEIIPGLVIAATAVAISTLSRAVQHRIERR